MCHFFCFLMQICEEAHARQLCQPSPLPSQIASYTYAQCQTVLSAFPPPKSNSFLYLCIVPDSSVVSPPPKVKQLPIPMHSARQFCQPSLLPKSNSFLYLCIVPDSSVSLPSSQSQIASYTYAQCQTVLSAFPPPKVKQLPIPMHSARQFCQPSLLPKSNSFLYLCIVPDSSVSLPSSQSQIASYTYAQCQTALSAFPPPKVKQLPIPMHSARQLCQPSLLPKSNSFLYLCIVPDSSVSLPSSQSQIASYTYAQCQTALSAFPPPKVKQLPIPMHSARQFCQPSLLPKSNSFLYLCIVPDSSVSLPSSQSQIASYTYAQCQTALSAFPPPKVKQLPIPMHSARQLCQPSPLPKSNSFLYLCIVPDSSVNLPPSQSHIASYTMHSARQLCQPSPHSQSQIASYTYAQCQAAVPGRSVSPPPFLYLCIEFCCHVSFHLQQVNHESRFNKIFCLCSQVDVFVCLFCCFCILQLSNGGLH